MDCLEAIFCTTTAAGTGSLVIVCILSIVTIYVCVDGLYTISKHPMASVKCTLSLKCCLCRNEKKLYKLSILVALFLEIFRRLSNLPIGLDTELDTPNHEISGVSSANYQEIFIDACNTSESTWLLIVRVSFLCFTILSSVQQPCMILCYYFRLSLLFKGSIWDINAKTGGKNKSNNMIKKIIYVCSCLYTLFVQLSVFCMIFFFDTKIGSTIFIVGLILARIVILFANVYLAVILYKKMKQFIKMTIKMHIRKVVSSAGSYISYNNNNNDNDEFISSDTIQENERLQLLIKLTLLMCFACMTSILVVLILIVDGGTGIITVNIAASSFIVIYSIDQLINVYCLVLQFENYDKYYTFFCGKCHLYWNNWSSNNLEKEFRLLRNKSLPSSTNRENVNDANQDSPNLEIQNN